MLRILVYEPLSAGDPASIAALGRGSPAHRDMLEAGRAMRDALAADLAGIPGVEAVVAVDQQEAGHAIDGARCLSPRDGESAVDFVGREAPDHDLCWIVAPECDGLLLRLHAAVGEARWIGCEAGAIRIAASKQATCEVLARAGVATPLAYAAAHRGAWIVKPDDGAGTLDTRRHATRPSAEDDLQQRATRGRVAVLQPFVEGEALSISLLAGPVLARPIAFNRQQLHVDADGVLHDLGVQAAALAPHDARVPALRSLATRVAAALPGLRGYVGIDVVWNERDGPVVIEVNPRLTCAYAGLDPPLRRRLAEDILALHARVPEEAGDGRA